MFKMYMAKFKTSEITEEILRTKHKFEGESKIIEGIAEALRNVNGIEVCVAEWKYSPDNYSILGHNEDKDTPLKELVWSIEQDGGAYCGNREAFDDDWEAGEYEPDGSIHFDKGWFNEVKFLKEVN